MFLERGGSSMFARHAFNELVSFIAGWAILIDYLIVIAAAAVSVPHYLTPISDSFHRGRSGGGRGRHGDRPRPSCLNIAGFTGKIHGRAGSSSCR